MTMAIYHFTYNLYKDCRLLCLVGGLHLCFGGDIKLTVSKFVFTVTGKLYQVEGRGKIYMLREKDTAIIYRIK